MNYDFSIRISSYHHELGVFIVSPDDKLGCIGQSNYDLLVLQLILLKKSNHLAWIEEWQMYWSPLQGKKNPGTDQQAVESFLKLVKDAKEMKIDK